MIEKSFRTPLSVPALPGKTDVTLPRRSNGLLPSGKPCPFLPPEYLARAGTAALLSFQTSQALPLATLGREHLRLFLPLSSLGTPDLAARNSTDLRVLRADSLALSPLQGAGLSGLSDRDDLPTPSEAPPAPDYFFISKSPEPRGPKDPSLRCRQPPS
jgi:hypothetical protein